MHSCYFTRLQQNTSPAQPGARKECMNHGCKILPVYRKHGSTRSATSHVNSSTNFLNFLLIVSSRPCRTAGCTRNTVWMSSCPKSLVAEPNKHSSSSTFGSASSVSRPGMKRSVSCSWNMSSKNLSHGWRNSTGSQHHRCKLVSCASLVPAPSTPLPVRLQAWANAQKAR